MSVARRTKLTVMLIVSSYLLGLAAAAKAETWPTFEELASSRFHLIVHVRVDQVEGRALYKVLDAWKGAYSPLAFAVQPPTGYLNTTGPDGGAAAHKPGDEVVLFYTLHNRPKQGFHRHDMAISVSNGKLTYSRTELDGYTVAQFKHEIVSRIDIQGLQGTWAVRSVKFPQGRGDAKAIAQRFEGAELTFLEHFTVLGRTFPGHAISLSKQGKEDDVIRTVLHADTNPKGIDLLVGEFVGEGGLDRQTIATLRGIYCLDGDELDICMATEPLVSDVNGPRSTKTNERPSHFDVSVGVLLSLSRNADKKPIEEPQKPATSRPIDANNDVNASTPLHASSSSKDVFANFPRSEPLVATIAWHRQTGKDQLRMTWFLHGKPQVAMRCLTDLSKYEATTFRDVHDHAIQSQKTRALSHSQVLGIGETLATLPESADRPATQDLIVVSFVAQGQTVARLYDRRAVPRALLRLYDLTGAVPPTRDSDETPNDQGQREPNHAEEDSNRSEQPILSLMVGQADVIVRVKAVMGCRVIRLGEEQCREYLQVIDSLQGDIQPGRMLLSQNYARHTVDDAGQPLPDPGMRLPVENGKEYLVFLKAANADYVLLDPWAGVLPYRDRLTQHIRQQTSALLLWHADEERRDLGQLLKQVDADLVRVKPIGPHPLVESRVVQVALPANTPYQAKSDAERRYKLGHAIGYMEAKNGKFAAHAHYSGYGEAWMRGWSDGWTAADGANQDQQVKAELPPDGEQSVALKEIDRLNKGGFSQLHSAAIAGDLAEAQRLLEQGANSNVRHGSYRGTPLQYAAAAGHLDMVHLLLKHQADVEAKDSNGRTPLLWAAKHGRPKVVEELLSAGAALDPTNMIANADAIGRVKAVLVPVRNIEGADWQEYLLVIDPIKGQVQKEQRLLETNFRNRFPYMDPKPRLPVQEGQIYIAFLKQTIEDGKAKYTLLDPWAGLLPDNPSLAKAVRAAVDTQAHLDSGQGVQPSAAPEIDRVNDQGFSKLHNSAIAGDRNAVKQLLEQGANPNVRQGTYLGAPLQYAAAAGHIETVRLLLAHDAFVNAVDSSGRTPLMWAAMKGKTDVVRALLKAGADPKATTPSGWTAARYATEAGHQETAATLQEARLQRESTEQKPKLEINVRAEPDGTPIVYFTITTDGDRLKEKLAVLGGQLDVVLRNLQELKHHRTKAVFFLRNSPQSADGAYSSFTLKELQQIVELPIDQRGEKLSSYAWAFGKPAQLERQQILNDLTQQNTNSAPPSTSSGQQHASPAQPQSRPASNAPPGPDESNAAPAAEPGKLPFKTLEPSHAGPLVSMAFAPDGQLLATGALFEREGHAPNLVMLRNLRTAKLLRTLSPARGNPPIDDVISAVVFSPDGARLAVSGGVLYHGNVVMLDVKSGKVVWAHRDIADTTDVGIAFSPDGRWLASTGISRHESGTRHRQQVYLWDAANGKLAKTFEGHEGILMAVTFSPDGKTLATASSNGAVDLWNLETGKLHTRLRAADHHASASGFVSVVFSPGGNRLAVSHSDGKLRLWNPNNGTVERELPLGKRRPRNLAFSPNGNRLACANWVEESISLWSVDTGEEVAVIHKENGGGTVFAFSPDGKTLATGTKEGAVRLVPIELNE